MSDQPSHLILRHIADADERKAVLASYADAALFREKAVAVLQRKWHQLHGEQTANRSYGLPAWPYQQADHNGALRTIEEVLHEIFNIKVTHHAPDQNEERSPRAGGAAGKKK
jgi:hypothetical protein